MGAHSLPAYQAMAEGNGHEAVENSCLVKVQGVNFAPGKYFITAAAAVAAAAVAAAAAHFLRAGTNDVLRSQK